MKRVQDWLLRFRWQKLLLVWGVFLLIAAVLFAERSGVQYTHTRFRLSYLPQEQAISKAQALQEQPTTCLLLCEYKAERCGRCKRAFYTASAGHEGCRRCGRSGRSLGE